jgi:hypothetical protein
MRAALREWGFRELLHAAWAAAEVCLYLPIAAGMLDGVALVDPLRLAVVLLASLLLIHYLVRAVLGVLQRPWLRGAVLGFAIVGTATLAVHAVLDPDLPLWRLAWPVRLARWLGDTSAQALVVPREAFLFLLVVFLWWRGLALAQRATSTEDVAYRFRVGVLVLSVTAALGSLVLSWAVEYVVFGYFFTSLLAVAAARAGEASDKAGAGGSVVGFGWLAGLVLAGLLLTLTAMLVASGMTGDNLALLVRPLVAVARAVVAAIVFLAALLARLVVPAVPPIQPDADQSPLDEVLPPLGTTPTPGFDLEPGRLPVPELAALRAVAVLGAGVVIIVLVVLSARWLRRSDDGRKRADIESVWQGVDVARALKRLRLRAGSRIGQWVSGARSSLAQAWTTMTIKRLYGRVLRLAQRRGYPRGVHETPYEFLPTLEHALPELEGPLAVVTEAYVAVHYGELPEDPSLLDDVIRAWERIRATARQ